eukprot:TRINITY_DN76586_c0_g1_i1.p1 TRINITY_DN76586_c0_g1~~TRINITY_DN76586_c0_g1_i1.p1  ORF type:complete len:204 (+),score=47.88 TRINITY_DN76586_c0_g1_i1:56-667(+)
MAFVSFAEGYAPVADTRPPCVALRRASFGDATEITCEFIEERAWSKSADLEGRTSSASSSVTAEERPWPPSTDLEEMTSSNSSSVSAEDNSEDADSADESSQAEIDVHQRIHQMQALCEQRRVARCATIAVGSGTSIVLGKPSADIWRRRHSRNPCPKATSVEEVLASPSAAQSLPGLLIGRVGEGNLVQQAEAETRSEADAC